MKRCSTILISEDGERSIKVCTSASAPILCGCDLNVKPWKRKPFRGHELLDDGNDAGGGGVVQDGDRVHEVGQGAEEPSNPIKGRALPEQFLHIGPMVQSWSTTQSVEKDCKRQSSTCPCPSRTTFSRCSRSALWISVRRYALVGGGTAHDRSRIEQGLWGKWRRIVWSFEILGSSHFQNRKMHRSWREVFLKVVFHGQSYLVSNSFFFSVLKMGGANEQIILYDDG